MIHIIYSHSSYLDILKVQYDYFQKNKNENDIIILFINYTNNIFPNNFDKIIYYNETLNYSKRILHCIKECNITDKFIIFHPDINILVKKNDKYIEKLINMCDKFNIDRLDFNCYKYKEDQLNLKIDDSYILIKNDNINDFIYNVGTAIYNLNSFKKLLENFDYSYRIFETTKEVQIYCKNNMNCYYLNNINGININCGYYHMTNILLFIHITHDGKLLPKNNNENKLELFLQEIYDNITENYTFNKKYRDFMHK